ncbi:MAG: complex I subunit 5 family protein [Eubacteriales bacterium]
MEHLHESELISYYIPEIGGYGLNFTIDGFRLLYVAIFSFMWLATFLFSLEYFQVKRHSCRYYIFNAITYFATVCIFLSADLMTTFLFFEMMSFSSYVWVVHEENKDAIQAANTYLTVAVIGGLVMLMGLLLLQNAIHTLHMSEIADAIEESTKQSQIIVAGVCILFGFAAKAGVYPLHIWLPKAHPVAPAPASALLSGALTKTGIFGILIVTSCIFMDNESYGIWLLSLGTITMLIGAISALCAVHIKRILACSSMSQIGFILIGIAMYVLLGEHNTIAARGVMLHMMNHSLLKLILFMFAGILMMHTHKGTLEELKGYGRGKKLLHLGFLLGALGITGIPLFNGYLSKTLLHESLLEGYHLTGMEAVQVAERYFLLAGGITFAYMTKIYIAIFWERNEDHLLQAEYQAKKVYMNPLTTVVFLVSACVVPVLGMLPTLVTDPILDYGLSFFQVHELEESMHYFAFANLKGAMISVTVGIILYIVAIRKFSLKKPLVYEELWPKNLDLEYLVYKPLLIYALPFIGGVIARIADSLVDGLVILLRKTLYKDRLLPYEVDEGNSITFLVGTIINGILECYDFLFHKGKKNRVSYVHKCAFIWDQQLEFSTLIGRSLSFGLFMFCIGLTFIFIYVIFL